MTSIFDEPLTLLAAPGTHLGCREWLQSVVRMSLEMEGTGAARMRCRHHQPILSLMGGEL